MKTSKRGFTLIEVMIVVLVIGILLAIAVPNFTRARSTSRVQAIMSNLRHIDIAVQEWGMSQNMAQGSPVLRSNLDGTGGTTAYLNWPTGPVPGNYAVTTLGASATFDGGSLGAMDFTTWKATCSPDPGSCGL